MKGIFWKEGEAFTNSMNLIVSLLVRYPGIATISLDPVQKFLQFTFVVKRSLTLPEFERFSGTVTESLQAHAELNGRAPRLLDLRLSKFDDLSFLEIKRDIDSLQPEEIALLTTLIDQEFGGELVQDQEETLEEEDQAIQEEMIEHMLEDLKDSRQEKKLIGFREEGRVMVFNRAGLHK
ncbi:MAG: hypothetical protein ACM3X6_08870 [Patescibacteria group bacterium]